MVELDSIEFAKQIVREYTTFDWSPRDGLSVPQMRWLNLAQAYLKIAGVNIQDD